MRCGRPVGASASSRITGSKAGSATQSSRRSPSPALRARSGASCTSPCATCPARASPPSCSTRRGSRPGTSWTRSGSSRPPGGEPPEEDDDADRNDRPDRGGARDRPDARALHGARLGLGRGAVDARRGGARPRARGRALRALRLERRSGLPGPPALRHAVRVRRPCREGARQMSPPRSDGLVIFGASGDLAYKKIFPALDAMTRRGHLDVPVVGVARSEWTLEQFRGRARESIERHGRFDEATFARLRERLRYVRGDYGDPVTLEALRRELGAAQRPLHYLAIPPSLFETVVGGLGRSSCARDARVVVQNHMLQVVGFLAMEAPATTYHESIRDEQVKVFRTIRPLSADDLVRGQFRGYRKEKGVAADSTVETFAAARRCDGGRPDALRAGGRGRSGVGDRRAHSRLRNVRARVRARQLGPPGGRGADGGDRRMALPELLMPAPEGP